MDLSPELLQAIDDLAGQLCDKLPSRPHQYGIGYCTFSAVAEDLGLAAYFPLGSLQPAIANLLEGTIIYHREKLPELLVLIVKRAIISRQHRRNPLGRQEMESLNEAIAKIGLTIPELCAIDFLNSLPSIPEGPRKPTARLPVHHAGWLHQVRRLAYTPSQTRIYAFEVVLTLVFAAFELAPTGSFRVAGEQINGRFQLDGNPYVLVAKWHDHLIGYSDLIAFRETVDAQVNGAHGLLISYSGFMSDGLDAFSQEGTRNMIGMTVQDVSLLLEKEASLPEILRWKARGAAENGCFYVPVNDLLG